MYRPRQKDKLIPCDFWFYNDVTGFEIQSRASSFPVSAPKQKALGTVAVFSSAYCCVVGYAVLQNLCKSIFSSNSPKKFFYISANKCLSILSEKILNIFLKCGNTIWFDRSPNANITMNCTQKSKSVRLKLLQLFNAML